MKTDEKLWEICMEIYREMYNKCNPPADFDELIRTGEAKKENFFRDYYLPNDMHVEILEKHMKKNRLTKRERNKVSFTVNLGSSPSSTRKVDKDENICTGKREACKGCNCA